MKKLRNTYRIGAIALLVFLLELGLFAGLIGIFVTLKKFDPSIALHHEEWRWLLLASPILSLAFIASLIWRNRAIKRLAGSSVLPVVAGSISPSRVVLRYMLWRAAVFAMTVALLGPKIGSKIEEVEAQGIDLMVALDVSNSMLAEDVKPSRMDQAKRTIERLIKKLGGNRIGIVIFAGDAYVQLPLTSDVESARLFLDAVNPGIVPLQGTAIGSAIDLCMESFDPQSEAGRMILLITDGENHEDDAVRAAADAAEAGVVVCAIGAGMPGGAPIPKYNSRGQRIGFHTGQDGKTVVSIPNENLLIELVDSGKGVYVRSNVNGTSLQPIFDAINEMEKGETGSASFTDHEHLYHLFAGAGLVLILLQVLLGTRKWNTQWRIA